MSRARRRLLALLALVLCVALARAFLVAIPRVQGRSMAPTLEDGEAGGDRLLVWKPHAGPWPPDRFDLLAFRAPAGARDSALYVKRVWGLPGERVRIQGGDVWIGTPGAGAARHVRRALPALRATLIPVASLAAEPEAFAGFSRDAGAAPSLPLRLAAASNGADAGGTLRLREPIDDGVPAARGGEGRGGNLVNDTALEVEVRAEPGSILRLELREGGDVFVAQLEADGPATLSRLAGPAEPVLARSAPGTQTLPAGRRSRVWFSNVDDRVVLAVDGSPVMEFVYEGNTEVFGLASNAPGLAVAAGAVEIHALAVSRDVYVTADGEEGVGAELVLPPDAWFVLGDNARESRDSRHFGPIREPQVEGVVLARVWPPGRIRGL